MRKLTSCVFCGANDVVETTEEYTYQRDDKRLIVKNVPCYRCTHCHERYYEGSVLKRIEEDFHAIYHNQKTPRQTIQVPVEEYEGIAI